MLRHLAMQMCAVNLYLQKKVNEILPVSFTFIALLSIKFTSEGLYATEYLCLLYKQVHERHSLPSDINDFPALSTFRFALHSIRQISEKLY